MAWVSSTPPPSRARPAPGLVVIGLRPPIIGGGGDADEAPEPALVQNRLQGEAGRTVAVLQHDAEPHAGHTGRSHQRFGARGGDLDRLFQQDVLAGGGAAARDIEMGIGRRQDQHGLDRAIVQDGLELLGERKIEVFAESFPPRRRRTVGVDDLDPIRQIAERPGMRGDGHAETDQGDALLWRCG
jgi:hypothetical protein